MTSRNSMYSMASEGLGSSQTAQVSTTGLLNNIQTIYLSSQPHELDASASLVINTWLTAAQPGLTVDASLAARVWEHARRRAEDGCVILGSLHHSSPSVLIPFLNTLPFSVPSSIYKSLEALRPFLRCVTPYNPSAPRQIALGVTLTLGLSGTIAGASLALSHSGIDTDGGLLNVPSETGYRAFDVFYYLLASVSTPAEQEFLGLKSASSYTLLANSGTYEPPSYLATAHDGAAADDFRQALKEIGIKGSAHRHLISTLAAVLKLGNTLDYATDYDELEEICEDVGGLLGIEPEVLMQQLSTEDRRALIEGVYEALVDWVISKANSAISGQILHIRDGDGHLDGRSVASNDDTGDTVSITIIEIPDPTTGKALAMRTTFDDSFGINAEMLEDGVGAYPVGSSIIREMQQALAEIAPDLGIMSGPQGNDRRHKLEKREAILEKVTSALEESDGFLKELLFPIQGEGINSGHTGRFDLSATLSSSRTWYHLSLYPTDDSPASLAALAAADSTWSADTVYRQLRSWRLPEWANRKRHLGFTADFDFDEFARRYGVLGCKESTRDGIESWVSGQGWINGEVFIGKERIWVSEGPWMEAEGQLDVKPAHSLSSVGQDWFRSGFPVGHSTMDGSNDHLVHGRNFSQGNMSQVTFSQSQNLLPSTAPSAMRNVSNTGDYGLGNKGDTHKGQVFYNDENGFTGMLDPKLAKNKQIETKELTFGRRAWIGFVWALTFWIPSPALQYVGGMRRPDVRMAWREKLVLCFLVALINGAIVFWIIWFGKLLCPNSDKAWNQKELRTHMGDDDFWVGIHGKIYDITDWYKQQHSDTSIKTTKASMMEMAGMVLDDYFRPPLHMACQGLGIKETTQLSYNNTLEFPNAQHISGYYARDPTSALHHDDWYWTNFQPKIKEFYHGDLVWKQSTVKAQGEDDSRMWVRYGNQIYDLTDYFYTIEEQDGFATYKFLNNDVSNLWKDNPGQNIKPELDALIENSSNNKTLNAEIQNSWLCIQRIAYKGITDFRDTPKCQVNNYFLLAFAAVVWGVIGVKFIAALRFGSKRRPSPQDKFVICQVPAFTEGEDSLRKALDSLTALHYDNKRKLICVICDGVVVGQGNDRPTPKIVLDILGVDPKLDPPALPFKSVGTGAEQLNYGKVYSGLYEYEGNVVPYLVIVKVGKESEQSKARPGNRGKRDSQILLMSFLNRVHHRTPMSPLELEMFHQVNNIIGVDPELYEYLLMIDADTCVGEDSLNRLVAACTHNAKIAGICGETVLENDEKTLWTMIQVYEYFISHHLAKAFESLFGSVTCLPGCFTMYRLRTIDKGKPLIISDAVIKEYSVCDVDTLHKKNLLSLGEDRYLTTLMIKHFPTMSYKFTPDATCKTAAPESWSVLLSQRRRWINSTIHNLVELMQLKDLCGFCCFSMRFVVIVDLCGTIMLPSTCAYLGYLIYLLSSKIGPTPYISLAMIAAVYGLQMLVFILKREWQYIGWMIIYIVAFPIYSFVLPIYSFWNQDNFSWGNTRIVIGEKGSKQIAVVGDEGFDPRTIPLQRWDDYALANNLPGRRGEYQDNHYSFGDQYEMDEIKSIHSLGPQGSLLPGIPSRNVYSAPQFPALNSGRMSAIGYQDSPTQNRQSMLPMGTGPNNTRSQDNLSSGIGGQALVTTPGVNSGSQSPNPQAMWSQSSLDFQQGHSEPSDTSILDSIRSVLREVDLDTVTKKEVRALVERKLQTELVGKRRIFMDRQIDCELEKM
ncbi:chitin synthase-domain-containing protein [Dactylonectria macrodidyma]|uniref:chitin synthase n=1 Tax=Dactylonectria macrodidyma TaxID=307937 RepID=A0A9P9DSQ0_9HYPO|nr:chitin synthase-domain-containing protein [Dactylonectria macrodidyma]